MATRNTTHVLKNSDIVNRPLPGSLFKGEPIINTADGILYFSGVTTSTSEWTAAGTGTTANFFEVGSNLYDLKLRNQITKYQGTSGSGLIGKFLSGTSTGFVLADISEINGISGFTYNPATNTFTITDASGDVYDATIQSVTGLTVNGTLSATTVNGNTVNINNLTVTGSATYNQTATSPNDIVNYSTLTSYTQSHDVYVTGGTYSSGTTTFNNNTGGTFNVTGYYTGSTVYANEIHVSALSGNDTTGDGHLLTPYATITKALSVASGGLIIVHPGTYTESPTSNVVVTIISVNDNASKTFLNGTLTLATATRVGGIRISDLVISNSGTTYIDDCNITTSFVKSGSGFVQIDNTTLQCSSGSLISGSGLVTINGDHLYPLVVNNASANVIIKISNSVVAPTVLAGTLSIVDSVIMAATPTGNAVTTSPGTVVTIANSQILVPTLDNVARVSLSGFYSIFNVIYDKPNSTLVGLSGTGGSTNSIDYFQYINADRFITQGGTSTQYVMGDGTLSNGFTADTYVTGFTYSSGSNLITLSQNQGQSAKTINITSMSGLSLSNLTAGRVVYVGSGGTLTDEGGFTYDDGTNTLSVPSDGTVNVGTGGLNVTGDAVIEGSLTVFGPSVSAFTSNLYVEDSNITLNYNPTGSTTVTSIGAGWTIQDGSGISNTATTLNVGVSYLNGNLSPNTEYTSTTGNSNRNLYTQLGDIIIRNTNYDSNAPDGVRVLAEGDLLDGGIY